LPKKIGLLYGQERSFPPALAQEINRKGAGKVVAEPCSIGPLCQDIPADYDVILDRISHDVPFYRTYLKQAAAAGVQVVNNPFWWSCDDKYFNNVVALACGVAVPKTVLLPHKEHPPNTKSESYSNLVYPVDWESVFAYLGFPIFMKPADGGGWRDVYKVDDRASFFRAYDRTGSLSMMAQEAIEFTEYYRCYCVGRRHVRVMRYDPRASFENRYVKQSEPAEPKLARRIESDCLTLCRALGYDLNTIEFALRDGVPYAIDFMNPAPDCDLFSVGQENFDWILKTMSDLLIDRAMNPKPIELTGNWPEKMKGVPVKV
jgi:glutathione synthase/RimK-type ligase-like ATP-grasp enzyme